jgi:hypothetical protein
MSRFYNQDEPSESGHVFDQLNKKWNFVNGSFLNFFDVFKDQKFD